MTNMFNLDNALASWRAELQRQQGLEPGTIAELESNLLDRFEDYKSQGIPEEEAFQQAVTKSTPEGVEIADEFYKVRARYSNGTPPWKERNSIIQLLPNYAKVALRSFARKKFYTSINYVSLVVGLICACMVFLYIRYELSFDAFHEKSDRIVRIGNNFRSQQYSTVPFKNYWSTSPEDQMNQIQAFRDAAGVEDAAQFFILNQQQYVELGDKRLPMEGILETNTPASFFHIFDWKFIRGNAELFSSNLNKVVLTEETANKLLGNKWVSHPNLHDETIMVDSTQYQIAGVIENIPSNSHYEFNLALHKKKVGYWGSRTYVLLDGNTTIAEVRPRIENNVALVSDQLNRETSELYGGLVYQPVEEVHLYSNMLYEMKTPGNTTYLWIFGLIGLIILVITCTNYTNLSIAMYSGRNREIGMRKVLGAQRGKVISQFLLESIILTLFTLPLVLLGVNVLLPKFNSFMDVEITNLFLLSPTYVAILLVGALLVGIVSSIYPAIVLSGKKVSTLFRKQITSPQTRALSLRKGLIAFQFALLIGLGSATWFINQQLEYIQSKDLGYAVDGVVYVRMYEADVYDQMKNQLDQESGIIAMGSGTPLGRNPWNQTTYRVEGDEEILDDAYQLWMNFDALKAYDISTTIDDKIHSGAGPDTLFLINQTAAEKYASMLGVAKEELIGRTITNEPEFTQDDGTIGFPRQIDGFFEDIHVLSLREEMPPFFLNLRRDMVSNWAAVRFQTENFGANMQKIESAYNNSVAANPFITVFQEENIEGLYERDRRAGTLTIYLSVVAFVISILGLVGLTAYLTTLRQKEIGVRKVLGASVWQIVTRMNREYLYLIPIALLAASPFVWLGIRNWLNGFAYRTEINVLVFIGMALLALLITVVVVSTQTLRAATENPVNTLRNEQ